MELDTKLLGTVRKILKKYHTKRLLVAVSGGVDSMVLLDLIARIVDKDSFAVINVDHDLRPDSATEVEFLRRHCQKKSYKFYTTKWTDQPDDEVGMEAAGREFRYQYFANIMDKDNYDTLLTAHHANDMAENILMKMIRSGNVYEVTSLRQQRSFENGQLVRPLLDFTKSELRTYAKKHDIDHVQDETNFENITMRNRLRNNIFPELQKENGQMLSHFRLFDQQLTALINLAVSQFQAIQVNMKVKIDGHKIEGRLKPLEVLDENQQTLFWGEFFTRNLDIPVSNKQVEQIITVILGDNPNASIDLEYGWKFIRTYNDFILSDKTDNIDYSYAIKVGEPISVNNKRFLLKECSQDEAMIITDKIPDKITLRNRRNGDKLLISDGRHQKLSKRFINEKIPEYQRNKIPLILFDNQVVWVEKIYKLSDYLKKGNYFLKIDFEDEV
ncbi:tRNA lysidine(34) synthetase TilS [Companilactobacillus jidongensis]|uniref:tRNA lysidine(34) synthetase TilS n=1 Tax=Companilactobacillus jidongensis TaxID=2486006 RepID=UPI000F782A86|nr:tRNA lysidine(34) synthetase TilS [Companilactobacillus jidongensis]